MTFVYMVSGIKNPSHECISVVKLRICMSISDSFGALHKPLSSTDL